MDDNVVVIGLALVGHITAAPLKAQEYQMN